MQKLLLPAFVIALCLGAPAFAAEEESDAAAPAVETSEAAPSGESGTPTEIDPKDQNTGGAGDLLIAPTRVVFEGRKRSAEIMLRNSGTKEATYRVELIHLHMDENGQYKDIKKEELEKYGEKSADAMLRYSPRQVTLGPKQTQTVKVMVRKVEGVGEGEYRSHLSFHANPDSATADVEAPPVEPGKISIRLIPVYGVSIPIIVRQGTVSAKAGIAGFKVSGKKATLTLTRSGNASLFGDVFINSGSKVIGEMRGVGVLLPNTKRNVTVDLTDDASGALSAEYRARSEDGGAVLARSGQ